MQIIYWSRLVPVIINLILVIFDFRILLFMMQLYLLLRCLLLNWILFLIFFNTGHWKILDDRVIMSSNWQVFYHLLFLDYVFFCFDLLTVPKITNSFSAFRYYNYYEIHEHSQTDIDYQPNRCHLSCFNGLLTIVCETKQVVEVQWDHNFYEQWHLILRFINIRIACDNNDLERYRCCKKIEY